MSGLYSHNFSPARTVSPQIRNTPDVESQYLTELLAEHQKLGPFMQVLPICSRLLNQEIIRVSRMASNPGFSDFDRLQHGSPSPMASSNMMPNVGGTGLTGWNSLLQEEDKLRGRPGYEHLNEPLHILVEAELPANIVDTRLRQAQEILEELLKPVDESHDFYKRQQLRELALLNSNLREESPRPSGSVSPFNSSGMKRAKTGR